MSGSDSISRRQFVAGASGALLASTVVKAAEPAANQGSQLAVQGGEKAVKTEAAGGQRWGEPERQQLESMLRQDTLFYWQGPQTQLLTDRFKQVCPVKYVHTCSSGTAALHIAVVNFWSKF